MRVLSLSRSELESVLASALKLDFPYADEVHRKLLDQEGRPRIPAAVLALFGYTQSNTIQLLYIQRTDSVATHKGQMAFPGGRGEDQESSVDTALRETEEEVGIARGSVKIIGGLPPLVTVSDYWVQPWVGMLSEPIETVPLTLDPRETADSVWVPLEVLLHPDTYRREQLSVGEATYPIEVFQVEKYRIWGATGVMTKNLLDRIKILG